MGQDTWVTNTEVFLGPEDPKIGRHIPRENHRMKIMKCLTLGKLAFTTG